MSKRLVHRLLLTAILVMTLWVAWPTVWVAPPMQFITEDRVAPASTDASPMLTSALINAADPPRVHAGSIAALPDGRMFATWFGGAREGATDVKVYGSIYQPESGAWSPQAVVASPEQTSADLGRLVRKMGNPVAFVTPAGELWVVYVSVTLGGWATSHLNLIRSPDLGQSWLPATRLIASPFLNLSTLAKGYPVFYTNGEIGLPVYHELAGKFGELLILTPEGRVKRKIRLDHGTRSLQPVLLTRDPQHAVAMLRYAGDDTPPRALRTETRDGGETWTPVEATDLANPNSALAGVVLDDGRLLAVANDTEDERLRLSLLVSDDDGRHWRAIHRFEDRQEYIDQPLQPEPFTALLKADVAELGPGPEATAVEAVAERNLCRNGTCNWQYDYPHLVRSANGEFHLVYTWNRSFIRHVRFNAAWLEGKL